MNEDDKPIYVASQQFSDVISRYDATPIYQGTNRHGLFDWAAKINLGDPWETYLSLAVWEIEPHKTLGLQTSIAQIHRVGNKYVRDFEVQISVEHEDYHLLEVGIQDLLASALSAAKNDLSRDPESKLPDLYTLAPPPTATW